MQAALMYGPNDIRYEDTEKPVCPQDGLILKIMAELKKLIDQNAQKEDLS